MGIKEKINQATDKLKVKKAEREHRLLQQKAEVERREAAHLAAEKAAIEAEKCRLLDLDEKELMVELIFAVRGFYARIIELKDRIADIDNEIDSLESRISELEDDIGDLSSESSDETV